MTRTIALCTTLVALGGFAFACSDMSATSGFPGDRNNPGATSDAGAGDPTPNEGAAPSTGAPVDNAVILVHAAKSQSFRLCFKNELERRPQPDSQVMPEANVVGVEVGSTVRLGPLAGAPGEVFLFDEPSIRAVYPQFGGAGAGPTCGNLLSASNPLSKIAVSLGTIEKNLHTGVHLLVVRGCPGNGPLRSYSAAECGNDWTALKGNLGVSEIELSGAERPKSGTLPAQVVNLSQSLEGARAGRDVVIRFGDLTPGNAKLVDVTSNPLLFGAATPTQPAQLQYPTDDPAIFATSGFRIVLRSTTGGSETQVLDQTLERVQELSAPREVPPDYYAAASNYALLLLGDPDAKLGDGGPDTDDRRTLHFLAVPVIETKSDAGTDGGDVDGGAAPSTP
jgi:hypothetical protein